MQKLRHACAGCLAAANVDANKGLHKGKLVYKPKAPGEVIHADVVGPIVPMGIGNVHYVLVAIDEYSKF